MVVMNGAVKRSRGLGGANVLEGVEVGKRVWCLLVHGGKVFLVVGELARQAHDQ